MMFAKLLKGSKPKRILVFSLTNIGDVVLTCPVIDILRHDFPQAAIDVVTGPKAVLLFEGNPHFTVKVFNKRASFKEKCAWFLDLYRAHYDCVVDLRRTALALFLMPRYATRVFSGKVFEGHRKDVHLDRLRDVYDFDALPPAKKAIQTTPDDERFFADAVAPALQGQGFVVIAPGAADSAKRWQPQGFAAVADRLALSQKIVFVGDANDAAIVNEIQAGMKMPSVSLAGKISLRQLAFVLRKCSWAMVHDSGVMHLACYFNVPLVVLWGPTDLNKYAPWSRKFVVVKRNEQCPRCQEPKSGATHTCMSLINVEDVINAVGVMAAKTEYPQS